MVPWGMIGWTFPPAQASRIVGFAPEVAHLTLSLNVSALYFGIAFGTVIGGRVLEFATPSDLGLVAAAFPLVALAVLLASRRSLRLARSATGGMTGAMAGDGFRRKPDIVNMAVAVSSGAFSAVSQIDRVRLACRGVGIFADPPGRDAPTQGMNQEPMNGRDVKPWPVRVATTASPDPFGRPPRKGRAASGFSAFSQPTGGAATPALT